MIVGGVVPGMIVLIIAIIFQPLCPGPNRATTRAVSRYDLTHQIVISRIKS